MLYSVDVALLRNLTMEAVASLSLHKQSSHCVTATSGKDCTNLSWSSTLRLMHDVLFMRLPIEGWLSGFRMVSGGVCRLNLQ